MPNIPGILPEFNLTRDEAITLLLASIAMEEMGLAHILTVEGEKMQHVLGLKTKNVCIGEIIALNESVERVVQSVTRLQIILQEKLEQVLRLVPKHHYPDPCPPPQPIPKPCCMLVGCALGSVNNPNDEFYRASSTLEAHEQGDGERHSLKYTLFKRGKGCTLSAVLVPISAGLQTHCLKLSSCPRPEDPSLFVIEGQAVMSIHGLGEGPNKGTVGFNLKVWDFGLRRQFQMITNSRHDHFFNHDSGVVIVDQGNLRIKEVAGGPCGCHKEKQD